MGRSAISDPATVAKIRAVYQAEIGALAGELRPRFESGELRGCTEDEIEEGQLVAMSPQWRIEEAVRQLFDLEVKTTLEDGSEFSEGDAATAHVVLAASPSADLLNADGWRHVADWAVSAAGWDVLLHARAMGWSRPVPGEQMYRSPWEELEATRFDSGPN